MAQVYVVEQMAEIVARVNIALTAASFGKTVYYMYGHPKEINQRLQELSNSPTEKSKKFPLIILFTDIEIDKSIPGFFGSAALRMLVCTITEQNYTAVQRTENTFKPVLHPIKNELINQISKYEKYTYEGELQYKETDMYFYGSQFNDKNIFNDFIDAVQLRDIRVNIKTIC